MPVESTVLPLFCAMDRLARSDRCLRDWTLFWRNVIRKGRQRRWSRSSSPAFPFSLFPFPFLQRPVPPRTGDRERNAGGLNVRE
jgi:hypothetical protein